MKYIIVLFTMLFVSTSFAGGKFIFKPYKNEKSELHSVLTGLSMDKKIAGPLYVTNFTGINLKPMAADNVEHKLMDVYFNNALKFKPMDILAIEGGLELHKDVHAKADISETYYVKLSVDLW